MLPLQNAHVHVYLIYGAVHVYLIYGAIACPQATSKVLGIQNHRLAQCHYAKLMLHGPDTFPVQVDGEAWLQEPGTIVISHKNKARMLVKDKVMKGEGQGDEGGGAR